jgi:uncharacterized protein YbjT (DUF2867 family)
MNKILLAGSTGYLGGFIVEELLKRKFRTSIVVRNKAKIPALIAKNELIEIIQAEITQAKSVKDCCRKIDTVISTVGITKQKDGLTYMDVDYQANINLLEEARRNGVRKFIYVSILHGEQLTGIKICAAKEKFVEALKKSGMDYCIIRPTGYFSDMLEFYQMAQKGKIFLFGAGQNKMNPIHGADLAKVCVDSIFSKENEIAVGGPEIFSYQQIASCAFEVSGKKTKIKYLPNWLGKTILLILKVFTSSKFYGPIEFLTTVLTMEMVAPEYGTHTLKSYFEEVKSKK